MRKCFISYRHVKPDEDLARELEKCLSQKGHPVFVDTQMLVGTRWAAKIKKEIKASDAFIVLLSAESIRSDMVRQEVELAHSLAQERGEKFAILPIRVDFRGELPYDLGAYLNSIQYASWAPGQSFETIVGQILQALDQQEALPLKGKAGEDVSLSALQELFAVTDGRDGAPLPAADPRLAPQVELETGTIKLDSPFYIQRQADTELLDQIHKTGSTTIVKAPRQMGKSSLLARVHAEAKGRHMLSWYFDFQLIDEKHLADLDTLFQYLAYRVCKEFKTALKPGECWDTFLGAKENLMEFMQRALLEETAAPVVILLDEVDRLFACSFRDDFFATIRGWHNLRATEACWNKLNLVIAHSTEPYLWIQDMNQSPFNVGVHVSLADFDWDRVIEANRKHGTPLRTNKELQELIDLTGGQPYLVRLALYTLRKNNWDTAQLKQVAPDDRGPFGDHLRRFAWRLQAEKELKKGLQQILDKGSCDNEEHFLRLRAGGLVIGESYRQAQMRCQLYADYFRKHL